MSSNTNKISKLQNKISAFVEGNYNYANRHTFDDNLKEQVLYRALKCAPCTKAGACLHCGCPTPKLFFAGQKQDELKAWPPFFYIEEDWKNPKLQEEFTKLKEQHPEIVDKINKLWN